MVQLAVKAVPERHQVSAAFMRQAHLGNLRGPDYRHGAAHGPRGQDLRVVGRMQAHLARVDGAVFVTRRPARLVQGVRDDLAVLTVSVMKRLSS